MDITTNPIEQTYLDTQKLIYHIVWEFQKKYGGDFDELMGEANLIFMLTYHDYKKGGAKFSTLLHTYITNGLKGKLRKNYRTPKINRNITNLEDIAVAHSENMVDVIDLFQDDAKCVIELALNPDKAAKLLSMYYEKSRSRKGMTYYIKEYLKQDLGWNTKRITFVLKQIKKIIAANL